MILRLYYWLRFSFFNLYSFDLLNRFGRLSWNGARFDLLNFYATWLLYDNKVLNKINFENNLVDDVLSWRHFTLTIFATFSSIGSYLTEMHSFFDFIELENDAFIAY